MGWVRTVAPYGSAIDLDAAKLHLREDGADQDALILSLLAGASEDAETRTGRVLLHSRFALSLDAFPCYRERWVGERNLNSARIVLPHLPVVRVVSITYVDGDGVTQTLDSGAYVMRSSAQPVTVEPAYGQTWPSSREEPDAVTVTYEAGYASVCTANATSNTLTVSGPVTWAVGAAVRVSNSGGALPAPLVANTTYYVRTAASGVYTLAATAGGAEIDLTTAGTGTNFIGEIPDGMVSWIMLRLGALYENREALTLVERGSLQAPPFFDGLLDRFKVYLP